MDKASIGKKIKFYREQNGWKVATCAEKMGISNQYLSDIERGKKVPKLETFVRIINTLGVSADDILQDSLSLGYQMKENKSIEQMATLDTKQRNQAINILETLIASIKENEPS